MVKTFFLYLPVLYKRTIQSRRSIFILIMILIFGAGTKSVFAQTSSTTSGVSYVPLIGITSVPEPLALPKGAGTVTYHYAVKNFLLEAPLSTIDVVDSACNPVTFVTGDDNKNALLDYTETWRFSCTTILTTTTQSIATAQGTSNGVTASHRAYATVVVGTENPAPIVSIVNITKVAYPLSLPAEGGKITFTYKVNNPGVVPLSDVKVTDDKCSAMSGKLGDRNGNNLLDTNEVWIYTCTAILTKTTTNTAHVSASANELEAFDDTSLTVHVQVPDTSPAPSFPDLGKNPPSDSGVQWIVWGILSGILTILILLFFIIQKKGPRKTRRKKKL